jgi:glycosyltransferase involved in cell wall biosynthesis
MKVYYIAFMRLPTERAHGPAIMRACAAFARAGAEVELVVPERSDAVGDPFEYYGISDRFTITRISLPNTYRFGKIGFLLYYGMFSLRAAHYVRQSLRTGDVPYSRDPVELFLLGRALARRGVWEVHLANARWLVRFCARRLGCRVVAISEGVKDFWVRQGIPADRFLISPSGVDLGTFAITTSKEDARRALDLPQELPLVVYTGNFTTMGADKGIGDIIDALSHIPRVTFVGVGGADSDCARYKSRAQERHVADRVILRGHAPQDKLAHYQRAADVLLMPFPDTPHYRTYMSPVKMFEYMASERPIIASDLPSIREVLNGSNALLVPPNDPEGIARGIQALLSDPSRSKKIANAARADVEAYTWDARAHRILAAII